MPENIEPELTWSSARASFCRTGFQHAGRRCSCLEDGLSPAEHRIRLRLQGLYDRRDGDTVERGPETRPRPGAAEEERPVHERAFRKETTEAWPDLKGVESFFIDRQIYTDGIVVVVEIRRSPDGNVHQTQPSRGKYPQWLAGA